jgi:hypothetical protein
VLFGLIWVVALHGHSSNPSEPAPATPPASTPAPTSTPASQTSTPASQTSPPASQPRTPGSPSTVYHGAAPGVEGLTHDVAKAHEAVKTSEANAQQLQSKSRETSSESQPATAKGGAKAGHKAAPRTGSQTQSTQSGHSITKHAPSGRSPEQIAVERELTHGKTVMLLFWNPKSTVDDEVHSQAKALASHSKQAVALHVASANQVGLFGSITEVAHVYQTPTILIVNKHGVVSSLTGLTDVFSLEQAVREARKAGA